jgi:hypothetical protein
VRLHWKILQFGVFTGLTVLATGCGGLQGKYSISPLSFFLPGLVKADSKLGNPGNQPIIDERTKELAQTENSQTNF